MRFGGTCSTHGRVALETVGTISAHLFFVNCCSVYIILCQLQKSLLFSHVGDLGGTTCSDVTLCSLIVADVSVLTGFIGVSRAALWPTQHSVQLLWGDEAAGA